MKKLLRVSLMSMLLFMSGSAFAQDEVTIDFDADYQTLFPTITGVSSGSGTNYVADGEFNATTTSTAVSGVTVTVTASDPEADLRNRIWASSPRLRMYDGTLTITATKNFKKLVMNIKTNTAEIAKDNTVNTGTLDFSGVNKTNNGVIEWTGDTKELVMTIAGNTQFKSIVVSFDGTTVDISNTPETAYTVARAHELIEAGQDLGTKVYVKGKVVKVDDISTPDHPSIDKDGNEQVYGNATYWISDDGTDTNALEVYRGYGLNGEQFGSQNELLAGDEVIVYGTLTDYKGTHEFTSGSQIYSSSNTTLGIHAVTIDDANAPAYSLDGRRVNSNYRGVVIKNGKKVIMK